MKQLDAEEWEELEELEAIRAYDAAKSSREETIPLEQAIAEIEQARDKSADE
jgi:hypothetical protein